MGRKRTERQSPKEGQSSGTDKHARPIASRRPVDISLWRDSKWSVFLAAGLIALATVAAYSNSFAGPFVFDDETAIVENPTVRQLWPLSTALCPPNHGETVSGRPMLNLSFAINYAIGKLDIGSYHATNLAIHLLGSLLLFGILRRTFLLPAMREPWGAAATPLALVVALSWAIHPLQTESVTYIVQRAESLVGLFYLLTLYCFIRGVDSARATLWHTGATIACLLGMASKEVMVSAPLIVLLYDRTFVAGSFREAWRQRRGFYAALAGTWLLSGCLVIATGGRGGSAGFGAGVSCWAYFCTQCGAIVHYLRLCLWPHPLLLDYGAGTAQGAAEILPQAIALGLLGAATLVALWRWPKVGFLGAWFFAILAPTSSIVPVVTQTIAEHRMYLPLLAVLSGLVLSGYSTGQWLVRRRKISLTTLRLVNLSLVTCATAAFGIVTFQRNIDYQSDLSIWQDTVAKAPENWRAYNHVGVALAARGQVDEAIAYYQKALEIKPDCVLADYNLGNALAGRGQTVDATAHYRRALELRPDYVNAHNNFGVCLARRGQFEEAIAHYQEAVRINPDYAAAYSNLGDALGSCGRFDEAVFHYQRALEINPDYADTRQNCDIVLARRNSILQELAKQRALIRSRSRDTMLLRDTAWILATNPNASVRNGAEAVALAEQAAKLSGGQEPAILDTLAAAYAEVGRFPEAVETARKAIDLATQQNQTVLAKSIKSKLHSYEAKKPLRSVSGH